MMDNIFSINLSNYYSIAQIYPVEVPGDKNGESPLYGRGLNSYLSYHHTKKVGVVPNRPFDEMNVVCISPRYLYGRKHKMSILGTFILRWFTTGT